jgi:hypothetical protein
MSEASIETEAEPEPGVLDETGYGPEDVLGNPPPPPPKEDSSAAADD